MFGCSESHAHNDVVPHFGAPIMKKFGLRCIFCSGGNFIVLDEQSPRSRPNPARRLDPSPPPENKSYRVDEISKTGINNSGALHQHLSVERANYDNRIYGENLAYLTVRNTQGLFISGWLGHWIKCCMKELARGRCRGCSLCEHNR